MKLFLIGQIRNVSWDFQGVVNDEELAISACINKNYFYAPVILNEIMQDELQVFPEIAFPKA